MALKERIDAIVKRRNDAEGGIQTRIAKVKKWKEYVKELLAIIDTKGNVWQQVVKDSCSEEKAVLLAQNMREFIDLANKLLGSDKEAYSLTGALHRAQRGYVNLGIIGPWRIGKSQIIKQLTNLDTWLIPIDNTSNCTACPINVVNGAYEGQSNVAVIEVYSVEGMCENINEYIAYCDLGDRVPLLHATDNDEFLLQCGQSLTALNVITNPGGDKEGFFDKLKEYLENAEEYYKILSKNNCVHLEHIIPNNLINNAECKLGTIVLKNIDQQAVKEIFRPFVSYYAIPRASKQAFGCLASKSATIYTSFRFLDEKIGKLRLLDTPGIGECKLNVSQGLSRALKFDLDIAVATASVKPNNDDQKQIQSFHNILKRETEGRNPENWLYYMFNVYSTVPNMTSSNLISRHMFIVDDLKKNIEGGMGIELDASHYADIDALINKGITCPGEDNIPLSNCRDERVTLATFYDSILHEMVDSIEDVDNVFYKKSREMFLMLNEKFDDLRKEINALHIVDYDNQIIGVITRQMEELSNAIKFLKLNLRLSVDPNSETPTLSAKIRTYCQKDSFGKVLFEVVQSKLPKKSEGVDDPISALRAKIWGGTHENFSSFYVTISEMLKYVITSDDWNDNRDFDQYIALKRMLISKIEEQVLAKYDKDEADKRLATEKSKILEVYKNEGKLEKLVSEGDGEWHERFMAMLESDNQYPTLREIFRNFFDYKLGIEEALCKNIKKLRVKQQHRDKFIYDTDDETPFDGYEKALQAFAFSLYEIESAIKKELAGNGDTSYELIIETQETDFSTSMSPIKNVPSTAGLNGYSAAGKELMTLYSAHSEIFKEKDADKNAVSKEWKKKIEYKDKN